MLLQVAIWALANHPHSIEKELGISTQYRKRLEAIVVKMYVPEMPEGKYLNQRKKSITNSFTFHN